MSKLYFEIFDLPRKQIFGKLGSLKRKAVLGGGTAVSLQIGGRYSYDFDLFLLEPLAENALEKAMTLFGKKIQKMTDSPNELSFLTPQKVKISFIHFPFKPLHPVVKTKSAPLFNLKDLASNKAYTIGRRGEYRDYVDLFFLLKSGLNLDEISQEAKKRFKGAFSKRLFLEQLVYLDDLKDFKIDFLKKEYSLKQVKSFLESEVKRIC